MHTASCQFSRIQFSGRLLFLLSQRIRRIVYFFHPFVRMRQTQIITIMCLIAIVSFLLFIRSYIRIFHEDPSLSNRVVLFHSVIVLFYFPLSLSESLVVSCSLSHSLILHMKLLLPVQRTYIVYWSRNISFYLLFLTIIVVCLNVHFCFHNSYTHFLMDTFVYCFRLPVSAIRPSARPYVKDERRVCVYTCSQVFSCSVYLLFFFCFITTFILEVLFRMC